jgi:hypothetical protein
LINELIPRRPLGRDAYRAVLAAEDEDRHRLG